MFDFTPEQKMVRDMVRQWADKELAPRVPEFDKPEALPPYDLMRKMVAAFGLPDMARARFGKMTERHAAGKTADRDTAMGGDPSFGTILAIELARHSPGYLMSFGASIGLAGGAIMARGTVEQKIRFAQPLFTMEKIGAWSMTEPGAGSDAFGSMRTVARRDGDDYVLNGEKTFITNAPYADLFVVYAKLDDGRSDRASRPMHAFLVDRGTPGLETSKPMLKMGMHASPTGQVFLADVRVPKERLLGESEEIGEAREQARDVFHGERTGLLPMALGIIDRCLEESLRYAKTREQFGHPIAEYQLIQEKLARMYVARENVRNLLFKFLDAQKNKTKFTMAEACVCKLYGARMATEVALEAVQLMGGNGYMQEFVVERLARDAKLLQIGGGTDEIQILTIAREILRGGVGD